MKRSFRSFSDEDPVEKFENRVMGLRNARYVYVIILLSIVGFFMGQIIAFVIQLAMRRSNPPESSLMPTSIATMLMFFILSLFFIHYLTHKGIMKKSKVKTKKTKHHLRRKKGGNVDADV